jgi:hypothetical protein
MSKLQLIGTFLANPRSVITLGIQALNKKNNEINYEKKNFDKYKLTQLPTLDILDLVPDMQGSIHSFAYLNGASMATIIVMLKSLAKRFKSCSYLEVGSFRGENITNVADAAADCTSVTLSPQEMTTRGFPPGFLDVDRIFSKDKPNITYHLHDSQTFDFSSLNKKFDLISIDADNSYSSILQDTKTAFSLLKNDDSIVVWHNYSTELENDDVRQDVLAGLLDGTPPQYHANLYHVSNTICAIFIRGKFPTSIINFPSVPTKTFNVSIEAKKIV